MHPHVGREPNGRLVGCLRLFGTVTVVGVRCRCRGFPSCSQGLAAGPTPLRDAHLNVSRSGCSGLIFVGEAADRSEHVQALLLCLIHFLSPGLDNLGLLFLSRLLVLLCLPCLSNILGSRLDTIFFYAFRFVMTVAEINVYFFGKFSFINFPNSHDVIVFIDFLATPSFLRLEKSEEPPEAAAAASGVFLIRCLSR
ncbi:hypothetical protein E2C01_087107 [Portunus trituberculatus]|uniref:Uncharacterized protein n=1 Tax=Portunus trituberculatus TaxID=210409 RepID=A0A5B7JFA0_PORTR|nr:hypothetical protein [Portunus trituberculatus]